MKTTSKNNTHTKLGFTHLEATEIVVKLNTLLANYQVHFHKLQNYYWNVRGRDFFELHDHFGELYHDVFSNINEIATRVRTFNENPVSNITECQEMAEIKPSGPNLEGEFMVRELLSDFEVLLSFMIETTDMAASNGDVGTVDMINGFVKKLEKNHWMFNSWLKSSDIRSQNNSIGGPN